MKKPDILFFGSTMDRSELALFREIQRRGYPIRVLVPEGCDGYEAMQDAGFSLEPLRARHRMDRKTADALRQRLEASPPDLIYAPTNKTLAVSLMAAKDLPIKIVGYRGTLGHVKRFNPAAWMTYLHPRLDHIVCVSDAVREHLIHDVHLPPERLTTIYKGHDVAWYDRIDPLDLRGKAVPANAVVVGFAGNMRPVKGVDVLIRSLDHIPPNFDVHLLLIGEIRDPRVARLIKRARYRDRLTCLGYRPDAAALIKACDIFVMPSIEREGLPRAVIEAMSQERAVIVSDVGGMPEQVLHGGSGWVVPPRSRRELADAIIALARSPELRHTLGRAARTRIIDTFNINDTVNRMVALFESLCDQQEDNPVPHPSTH